MAISKILSNVRRLISTNARDLRAGSADVTPACSTTSAPTGAPGEATSSAGERGGELETGGEVVEKEEEDDGEREKAETRSNSPG